MLLQVENRHASVQGVARRFEIEHLTDPDLRQIGMEYARMATQVLLRIKRDDPELTRALTSLADSRDAAMRALKYTTNGG